MNFESDFSEAKFNILSLGQFFFHSLADDRHSPAIKVRRADNVETAVDLDLELNDKSRMPTLVEPGGFEDLTVVSVPHVIIRPARGITNILNGAGAVGSIPRGALVMAPGGQRLIRVKGPNKGTLYFNISTGLQTSDVDSAQCLWATKWEVIVRSGDKETVLFERKN
jgi:hypothetical protein